MTVEGVDYAGRVRKHIREGRVRYHRQLSLFRRCSVCRDEKLISDFPTRNSRPEGLEYRCKQCANAATIGGHRLAMYGVTRQTYNQMVMEQCGNCAICGRPETAKNRQLCVDHDHATGKIRGLLCSRCNTALGLMQDDDRIVRRALSYIGEHP